MLGFGLRTAVVLLPRRAAMLSLYIAVVVPRAMLLGPACQQGCVDGVSHALECWCMACAPSTAVHVCRDQSKELAWTSKVGRIWQA